MPLPSTKPAKGLQNAICAPIWLNPHARSIVPLGPLLRFRPLIREGLHPQVKKISKSLLNHKSGIHPGKEKIEDRKKTEGED